MITAADVATSPQNAIWLTGTDRYLAQAFGDTMWCGFCGTYTGATSGETCPKDCGPGPLADRELDGRGAE